MSLPGQMPLFGTQSVHVGGWSRTPDDRKCLICRVLISLDAGFDCCDHCAGTVAPVTRGLTLGGDEVLPGLEEAA